MIASIRILAAVLFIAIAQIGHSQLYDSLKTKLDSIVHLAIKREAFPGCVIYAAQNGKLILLQSYGYHTYDSIRRVAVNDIYDLASITKVTGATLALMKLYEQGKISLDDPLKEYVSQIGRKVGRTTIRQCLAHQAGLYPWIPYYQEIRKKNGSFKKKTVGPLDEDFIYSLSDSLYLHKDFYRKIAPYTVQEE